MAEQGLTLYQVEATLARLIAAREEMLEGDNISAINEQIEQYLRAEIRKVEGIRSYILNCEATAEATAAEAKRLKDAAAYWQRQADWMRGLALRTMQELGLAELPGRVGRLKLRENPPHVEIQGAAIVPDEYKVHVLRVPPELWAILSDEGVRLQFPMALGSRWLRDQWDDLLSDAKAELRLSVIAEALKQPCEACGGSGAAIVDANATELPCPACHGSKLRGVPGATMERGVRLEVK